MAKKPNMLKQLRGSTPIEEKGYEFRTKTEHFFFHPRTGIIACHAVQVTADGRGTEVGKRKWKLTREFLQSRDDIALMLLRTITSWRSASYEDQGTTGSQGPG